MKIIPDDPGYLEIPIFDYISYKLKYHIYIDIHRELFSYSYTTGVLFSFAARSCGPTAGGGTAALRRRHRSLTGAACRLPLQARRLGDDERYNGGGCEQFTR